MGKTVSKSGGGFKKCKYLFSKDENFPNGNTRVLELQVGATSSSGISKTHIILKITLIKARINQDLTVVCSTYISFVF